MKRATFGLAALAAAAFPVVHARAADWAPLQEVPDAPAASLWGSRAVISDHETLRTYELNDGSWAPVSTTSLPDIHSFELRGDLGFARNNNGDVLALHLDPMGWQLESTLASSCPACALKVDTDGSIAAIGLYDLDQVLLFDRVGGTWSATQVLSGDDGSSFGNSVSLEGDTLAVCANGGPGVVHVFEKAGPLWTETAAVSAPSSCGSACTNVILSGGRLTVSGGCELRSFERLNGDWAEIGPAAQLLAGPTSIDVAGDMLFVGEPGAELMGLLYVGRVEVFRSVSAGWQLETTILPPLTQHGFGTIVGASDGWIVATNLEPVATFLARVGDGCTAGDECPTGHCVDGFCCDSSCDGSCVACDLPGNEGVCSLVTGAPRTDHTACEAPSCSGGILDQGASCNGLVPECTPLPPVSCAPFVCSEGACTSPCTTKDDCVVQHVCANGACIPDSTSCATETILVHADGSTDDCAPYRCGSTGACVTHCASTEECAPGTVCTAEGSCLPTDTIEGRGSSCAAERRAPRSTDGMFWLGALASLTALRRLSARCLRAPGSRRPAPRCRSASLPSSSADQ